MVAQSIAETLAPQTFFNGEFHDWYRTVWGYSDHLVSRLLKEYSGSNMRVLDPFCGTGTTLVECMKRGVDSAGIDANPVSCFAARVKTNWSLQPTRLISLLDELESIYRRGRNESVRSDGTYEYIRDSGMLDRGWIDIGPLSRIIALKRAIRALRTTKAYKDAFTVALLDTLLRDASNVKFGPELYCGEPRRYVRIFDHFERRISTMAFDLEKAQRSKSTRGSAIIVEGDARSCDSLQAQLGCKKFTRVICSPPYPAEHDYTRNSRLELALLEAVSDSETLRTIKKTMVRSHTKGIYREDADASFAMGMAMLTRLTKQIDERALRKKHGFAKLYSRVTMEYFGGMARHLRSLAPLLEPKAILAYVVGDQSSYLQVPVPTAKILGRLAQRSGYELVEIRHWRDRSTRSDHKTIEENVLILRAP